MLYANILNKIRDCGGRISPVREAIIHILLAQECLLSHHDLIVSLKKKGLTPDRSTIFREIRFLTQHHIIHKHMITEESYYEIPHDHHHHLICLACEKITKILMRDHLICATQEIARKNHFAITGHVVEFYGYCAKCRTS